VMAVLEAATHSSKRGQVTPLSLTKQEYADYRNERA
jgi:hypothetical protein